MGEGITCYDSGQGQRLYRGLSLTVDQISNNGQAGITVSGFVADTTGGYSLPMQYAAVLVGRVWPGYPRTQRPNRRTYADDSGHFVLDSLAADDTLTVVSLAYAPVSAVVNELMESGDGR